MKHVPSLALPLSLILAAPLLGNGCSQTNPKVPFSVEGKLDDARGCTESTLTGLMASKVRLSVRYRDAKGALAMDGNGKPAVCDADLGAGAGKIEALQLDRGPRADLFVEAFNANSARIATGALLDVDLSQGTFPTVHLFPAEKFSCLPAAGGKAVRLATHRAFHTATVLPNGQVLFLGGVTVTATGVDGSATGTPEPKEEYFITGIAEVYDPVTRAVLPVTDAAPSARAFHHASFLATTAEGKYRILVAGGLAPKSADAAVLNGAGQTGLAPGSFKFAINANSTAAASEVVIYDPAAASIAHEPVAGLQTQDAAFEAGGELFGGGLALAGGIPLSKGSAMPTSFVTVAKSPSMILSGMLATPRAGASLVAVNDGQAIVVGGVGALMQGNVTLPAPFERIDLTTAKATPFTSNAMGFPAYLFATLNAIDPKEAAAPRVLISGGLEVQPGGTALDPPPATMQVVKAGMAGFDVVSVMPVGWTLQTNCTPADAYAPVAWNATTLLGSSDGVLAGDRLLSTGGSPRTECKICGDGSHTCAVSQSAIVTIPANGGTPQLIRADSLQIPRFGHTQSILADHTVLIAGGLTRKGGLTSGANELEFFNTARAAKIDGDTGDGDDPLHAELKALGFTRAPGDLAANGATKNAAQCPVPMK